MFHPYQIIGMTAWKDKQYSQETIGWWHLPKVELKYTLYGKAGAGSNPTLTTNIKVLKYENII
jgi:hypothetical protein